MYQKKDDNSFENLWGGWLIGTALLLAVYAASTAESDGSVLWDIFGAIAITIGGFLGSTLVAVAGSLITLLFGGEDGIDGMNTVRLCIFGGVVAAVLFCILHFDML